MAAVGTVAATTAPVRFRAWGWTAIALTPALVIAAAFLSVEVRDSFAEAAVVGGVGASALALAGPTAAVALGFLAARARERWGRVVLALGVAGLVGVAAGIPAIVRSPLALGTAGLAYAMAMFVVIVFVQAVARRARGA